MTEVEKHNYDVLIIGAGGAGLRAAIAAHENGLKVAVICKSLFGKAHTVMAEGGVAASMGNANSHDNWQVHFRDTMRGGKFLNNWRMAELHAKESPDRVWELETYGALFDRTKDGRISQRNFGGHEYPRLAHVGDRTGLELIRTMQQKIVSLQQDDAKLNGRTGGDEGRLKVFAECTITDLMLDETGAVSGAFGYWRESGSFVLFRAPAIILATGGIGKSFKVTSNSWECTGDGMGLALRAGSTLLNMEFVQFHPTGMVWPPSVKGILVTEGVRGDGGVLRNSDNKRFMFDYIPDVFRPQYADNEPEADAWYQDPEHNRRTPDLLPRDEVARAINSEVKAGRGSPHGGVFLDISSRLPAAEILRRLPSMAHQFKELADVDITAEPMEVGPTCHYVMGGIEVEPDTAAAARVTGLFAAGEVAGGMHGSNRLGGNSLSDLLVFGRRAGEGASAYVKTLAGEYPAVTDAQIEAAAKTALAPFETEGGENPYTLHQELQQVMNDLVGIIRKESEVQDALDRLKSLQERAQHLTVEGHRQFNPGWHLALDLRNMLQISECIARAALIREESRGGHTRDDFPKMSPIWRQVNLICSLGEGGVEVVQQPMPPMRPDLLALFGRDELVKYFTDPELADIPVEEKVLTYDAHFRVWRGDDEGGDLVDYTVEVNEGEVVLDIIHRLQATQAGDLAVRWNCKAGKCGSCSAEINGKPRLLCMTRMSVFAEAETVTVTPMRTFPVMKDLVTDVSFNYEKARQIPAFAPPPGLKPGEYRMAQQDVARSQEFRKCIECFLCQDVCHVIRDHEDNKESYAGPRFLMRVAELDMHPLDALDRQPAAQEEYGLGMCNITKCCTEVCPEHIKITDNALIPLKERVVDRKYDPVVWLGSKIGRRKT